MEDWISGTFAVLGTLMVLAGGALILLRTLGMLRDTAGPDDPTVPDATAARRSPLRRLSPATQLIGWGVLLLVIAALTVGVISFGINLQAGTE